MDDNVVKFPTNRIVRAVPQNGSVAKPIGSSATYREVRQNAKNVFDNLCFELFDTYKIVQTKEVNIDLPLLEDIILGMFRRNAELPDEPEPPPLRYA